MERREVSELETAALDTMLEVESVEYNVQHCNALEQDGINVHVETLELITDDNVGTCKDGILDIECRSAIVVVDPIRSLNPMYPM